MLLERIETPQDLKKLSITELAQLAKEIRELILDVVSKKGGHLAPNLGVVELTLAVHYVFDAPGDRIIWDVGHQSYAHKIITGRRQMFSTLREYKGLAGFPKRSESPYDPFGTGHSSTSISAALGMAVARDLKGEKRKVVAIIGDGSLTAGLAFEGLNQAGHLDKDLVVILNDNEMCISPTKGALSHYLSRRLTDPKYLHFREEIKKLISGKPGGEILISAVKKFEESLKGFFTPGILFEELGFKYVGPVRGHHLAELIKTLNAVKKAKEPILVHVLTKKGKGYEPAEKRPHLFHGVGPFDKEKEKLPDEGRTYTKAFSETLIRLAEENRKIVAITAAMPDGTGLTPFAERFPERFFDVGIAEQHAVTFAAGLAAEGLTPVVAIYSTFLQRAYDQIIHDVALQNLHVVFAIDRGGIVGSDGPTHHGVFDLSYLRHIPNMVVMAPSDEAELARMLKTAIEFNGPIALRYPRGISAGVPIPAKITPLEIGKATIIEEGEDAVILAIGHLVLEAKKAAEALKTCGIEVTIINARFVKPLDEEIIAEWADKTKRVITLEENVISGGFGSAVLETLAKKEIFASVLTLGIPDRFIPHGSQKELRAELGLDAESIAKRIKAWLRKESSPKVISIMKGG